MCILSSKKDPTIPCNSAKEYLIDVILFFKNREINLDTKLQFVLEYMKRKPNTSPLFDSSMQTIISCSRELSLHLVLFRKIHLNIEESLMRIEEKVSMRENLGKKSEISSDDINIVYAGLYIASKHARCIIFYLEKSVLSKFKFFNKIIMWFKNICNCRKGVDEGCKELLEKGS